MSDTAVSVENLSKRYLIGHESTQREQYTTLRDTIARETHNFTRTALDFFRGRQIVQGDEVEEFWALRDVSFEVKRGEVLGIIGRNGAGKSTLLKILSRITKPTKGRAILRGRVASLLEVGTGFHAELTGRENIFLNGAILGMTRAEIKSKFDEIVAFAEVERFLDTPVKRYSSGMYVRLAFAVAAHLEPEILAVDEVLAVGDAQFQTKCLGKIGAIARGGRTVLFVSHSMNAIERLCSRVIFLSNGSIIADGADVKSVIQGYLKVEFKETQAAWRANRIKTWGIYFEPLSIVATTEDGKVCSEIPKDSTFHITIEAMIDTLDPSLTIGFDVYNDQGVHIMRTYHTDAAPHEWPSLRRGINRLTVKFPGHFFNEGYYSFRLSGGLHCREWIFKSGSDVPTINLNIQGRLSSSPYWIQKRPGVLGPILPWCVD